MKTFIRVCIFRQLPIENDNLKYLRQRLRMSNRVGHAFIQYYNMNNVDLNFIRQITVHNDNLRLRYIIILISVKLANGYKVNDKRKCETVILSSLT